MPSRLILPMIGLAALAGCANRLAPPPEATPDAASLAAITRMQDHPCSARVARVLAGLGVPGQSVTHLYYDERRDFEADRIWGYDIWVWRSGQPGTLVITTNDVCVPEQVYGREGAQVPVR